MSIGAHHSAVAGSTTWLTPPGILDALGGWQSFDLDPCAARTGKRRSGRNCNSAQRVSKGTAMPQPDILSPDALNAMRASRKADREHIAHDLVSRADAYGATVRRRDEPKWRSTSATITLSIELEGVGALIHINDVHGGHDVLIHWHNTKRPVTELFP